MEDKVFLRQAADSQEPDEEHRLPDDLIEELDRALEGIELGAFEAEEGGSEIIQFQAPRDGEETLPMMDGLDIDPGIRQMQETFLEIARDALSPVARYMKALTQGEAQKELLELAEFVVTPMIPRVESVGLEEHVEELAFFRSLLLLALGERDQECSRAMREVVMEGFSKLSERFDLDFRGYRLAVKNLIEFYRNLKASEGVSEVDIRRFFSIGVPSMTWVRRTKVSDLTSLSGIEADVMAEIRRIAYQYRSVPPVTGSAKLMKDPKNIKSLGTRDVLDSTADTTEIENEVPLTGQSPTYPITGQA